jgi:hypothetical protein
VTHHAAFEDSLDPDLKEWPWKAEPPTAQVWEEENAPFIAHECVNREGNSRNRDHDFRRGTQRLCGRAPNNIIAIPGRSLGPWSSRRRCVRFKRVPIHSETAISWAGNAASDAHSCESGRYRITYP